MSRDEWMLFIIRAADLQRHRGEYRALEVAADLIMKGDAVSERPSTGESFRKFWAHLESKRA